MVFLFALYISSCGLICLVQGQILQLSTKFMSGNVIFTWTPSNYTNYDVLITRDKTSDTNWPRVTDSQYTVSNVLMYNNITIRVRTPRSGVDNKMTYNVSKIKTKVGDTVNLSWTASFFPKAGHYNVYHTYRENISVFRIGSSGVSYVGYNQSTKYTYLTRPFASTDIMFEIKDITLDDAGYYNGGASSEAAWTGGGVVLIVSNKPSKPKVTGDFNVEVNSYITLTCSSQSTTAPDYYSKLFTLSYKWFVNDTKMGGKIRDTLEFIVTKDVKYNRYSCTATEDNMESDRSIPVQINPLYGPETIKFTPEPILNINDKLTVREGETIGPFVCTADCNPPCNITWRVKTSDGFSDARSEMGTLLKQVQRDMLLFRCKAERGDKNFKQGIQLDVQYLDDTLLYINGQTKSNIELNENAPLRISCRVGGNPAPTILLSRSHSDTELRKMQGTWLNYTIDTAQCTDTDTYRCSGNSTGFNNTEKVININVLCNTRFDEAGSFKSTYGSKSGMDTTVNVAVPIIAYPSPQSSDFRWDGPDQVSAGTTLSTRDVSYKHVIESFIPVKDHTYFGYYTLSYKGQTVTRITINAEDVPQTPSNFTGYSYAIGSVNLTWVSGFNGGPEQLFILYVMEGSNWKVIGNVSDPGEGRLVHFDPGFLSPGQEYSFRIQSCNRINCSLLSADTRVTVKAISSQSTLSNNKGVTIGASLAGFVLIVLLAAFLAMYFLKKKKIEKNRESVKLDDSRQPDVVLYASVDKSDQKRNKNNADVVINDVIVDKKDNSPAPCGDMYASVDKSLLKKKGKQPDANTNEEHENLYANSEETKPAIKPIRGQKGKRSKVKRGSKGQEQKDTGANGEYGNVESRKVNQDGLIYIDVDFSNYTGSQTPDQNPLIHGDDDRTEYTFVDFTKKAPPIQETGDDEQK